MTAGASTTALPEASLLGLPPEVREKIFKYMFPARVLCWTQKETTMHLTGRRWYHEVVAKPTWSRGLAIIRTCRKLHDEAISVYGASMTLMVPFPMTPKLLAAFKAPPGMSQYIQSLQMTPDRDPFDLNMFPSLKKLSLRRLLGHKRGECTDDHTLLQELDESNDQKFKQDCIDDLLSLGWLQNILEKRTRPYKLRITTMKGFSYHLEHRQKRYILYVVC